MSETTGPDPGEREVPPWGTPEPVTPGAGQPSYGAPGADQPQYGEPGSGRPQYGQPESGDPRVGTLYGQPQYGSPEYGQPRLGGPGSGEPADPPTYGQPRYGPPGRRQPDGRGARGRRRGRTGGAGGLIGVGLLAKILLGIKSLAVLVKFKAAISLILSVGVYAVFWGWRFAVGFVLLLAVHELGHVAVLRAQGVPASAPMFIPFLGAFVQVKGRQRSVAEEAWSALAGPVVGAIGAFAVLQLADLNGSQLLRALAYTAFLINLFNLIPALPLDGGRVAGALHPAIWWAGLAALLLLMLAHFSPVLLIALVLGGSEAVRRWRLRRAGLDTGYYQVPAATRAWIAAAYLITAAGCLYGMHVSFIEGATLR